MDRLHLPKMPIEVSGDRTRLGWRERLKQRLGGRRLPTLAALLALLIVLDAGLVVYDAREATFNTVYVATVGKIRMLSQRLAKAAQQASGWTFSCRNSTAQPIRLLRKPRRRRSRTARSNSSC